MGRFFPVAVYAAMLGGTVGGQFLGMAVDSLALGRRVLWVPFAFSLLLEALFGERLGAARLGHPLSGRERIRLSLHYSLAIAAVSVPLVGWLAASHATREQLTAGGGPSTHDILVTALEVLLALVVYTAARTGVMALVARRRA